MHDEIKDWLYQNRHQFYIGLSLDGTQQMHNTNRSKSFSRIDADFFAKTWADQPIKMTISQETLPNLAEGVIFLHSLGFEISNNFAVGIDWTNSQNKELAYQELNKLVEYYLQNPDIEPCSLMDMKIEYLDYPAKKWCGVGTHMVVFDVDGTSYPCQSFLPMTVGKEKADTSHSIDFKALEQSLTSSECEDCILLPICPTCYGSNYNVSGDLTKKDSNLCQLTKIRASACAYLKAKKLLMKEDVSELSVEEYQTVKSALQIQDKLSLLT